MLHVINVLNLLQGKSNQVDRLCCASSCTQCKRSSWMQ